MRPTPTLPIVLLGLVTLLLATPETSLAKRPDGGLQMSPADAADHMTPELDRAIVEGVARNIETLRKLGKLPATVAPKVSGLVWPLGPDPGIGMDYHGISNFVDLNLAYPNQVRDYTCAARSYDNASGYNHRGIDYFIWPFPWHLMDAGAVDVRAAAPGTLIEKRDGAYDRQCSWANAPDNANYVIILHSDGTIARYLHFKQGSVTTLPIGTAIAAGQVLGKVGSSGISTGPHLHFEVRATNAVNAPVIEPHNGACNTPPSAWTSQRPYRLPAIMRLSTHGAAPKFPQCPDTADAPGFKDQFNPGDPITLVAAYRDLDRNMASSHRILNPDGGVFTQWNFNPAEDADMPAVVNGAYWYWQHTLPGNAKHGLWTYEATLNGATKRHNFRVGTSTTPITDIRGLIGAWFEPATSGQGMEVHWINEGILLVFFYGHHNDGENFFLLGQRNGAFEFGQTIDVALYETIGGRFDNFDPTLIQRPTWGVMSLTFNSCTSATAVLSGADGDKTLLLERLGRTPGLDCN